ncbi:hypothetical protein [Archaeoglobus profundus]|uniref:hypothetical protein n=1 Tax=Archaeoglobus profundus TaxID=84156 RepID=UPI001FDEBAE9|nr:hypothetical protein [Archaeoglobus profundus]
MKFGLSLLDIIVLTISRCIFEIPASIIVETVGFKIPLRNHQVFSGQKRNNPDERRRKRILHVSINLCNS